MDTATPLTFSRQRTLVELRKACAKRGFLLDADRYEQGSDYVSITFDTHDQRGHILVSMFNGRFFGDTVSGIHISSDKTEHDTEAWFQDLLLTVYVPNKQAASK